MRVYPLIDIRVSQSALTAKPPPALPACTVRAQLHLAQTQPGAPSQHQPQLLPSNAAHAINSAGVSGTGPESTIGGTLPQMQSQAPSSSMSTQSLAQATMNTNQKQVAAKKVRSMYKSTCYLLASDHVVVIALTKA